MIRGTRNFIIIERARCFNDYLILISANEPATSGSSHSSWPSQFCARDLWRKSTDVSKPTFVHLSLVELSWSRRNKLVGTTFSQFCALTLACLGLHHLFMVSQWCSTSWRDLTKTPLEARIAIKASWRNDNCHLSRGVKSHIHRNLDKKAKFLRVREKISC